MYHIPCDKRAKDSALKIYRSLRHVLQKKQLCDVTITDIKNECGVSRATFYRLFDNITDVLEMQLEVFFDEYLASFTEIDDSVLAFFKYFDKHSDLIYILATQNESIIKRVLERKISNNYLFNNYIINEYLLSLKVSIMTSLLCKWVERNKKESPEKMTQITKEIFSQNTINLLTKL